MSICCAPLMAGNMWGCCTLDFDWNCSQTLLVLGFFLTMRSGREATLQPCHCSFCRLYFCFECIFKWITWYNIFLEGWLGKVFYFPRSYLILSLLCSGIYKDFVLRNRCPFVNIFFLLLLCRHFSVFTFSDICVTNLLLVFVMVYFLFHCFYPPFSISLLCV